MDTIRIPSGFRIVIPKSMREQLGLKVGQKMQAILLDGRIQLIPDRPMASMQGFLKGIQTNVHRENDRRMK